MHEFSRGRDKLQLAINKLHNGILNSGRIERQIHPVAGAGDNNNRHMESEVPLFVL